MHSHCSYHGLGDLSTSLEMTFFFLLKKVLEKTLFFSRHFDQTKCVEKFLKAKQYYLCKIPTPTVIQSVAWNLLERPFVPVVISPHFYPEGERAEDGRPFKRKNTCLRKCFLVSGSDISSQAVSSQVLSARRGLTTVFGMRTGGTLAPLPPEWLPLQDSNLQQRG